MIYSSLQLEDMGLATTTAFNHFYYGENDQNRVFPRATPILPLVQDFLNLRVRYEQLCSDKSVCGLTAYSDTTVYINDRGIPRQIFMGRNEILIDNHLNSLEKPRQYRCRFTIAHECAHQLLYYISSQEIKNRCETQYAARRAYSPRELKTREDWNEWQANYLAAVILMPQKEMKLAMDKFAPNRKLICYDGKFNYSDNFVLTLISSVLCVSKAAARIRLEQLGYIEHRPFYQFSDPLEIWP